MYFTLKCLYETGKGHTNLIKMLMSFAKITYLFDTKKNHILLPHLWIYYCVIKNHIIEDQWFEDAKRKVNNTH